MVIGKMVGKLVKIMVDELVDGDFGVILKGFHDKNSIMKLRNSGNMMRQLQTMGWNWAFPDKPSHLW